MFRSCPCNGATCRHCGVRVFGIGTETPIGRMHGLKLGGMTTLEDKAFSRLSIASVHGRAEGQDRAPAFSAHLRAALTARSGCRARGW